MVGFWLLVYSVILITEEWFVTCDFNQKSKISNIRDNLPIYTSGTKFVDLFIFLNR